GTQFDFPGVKRMLRPSIKRRIIGIATGMIILAVITSVMSMVLASRVGHLLDELTNRYIPAYAGLARVDIRSLERALMLRRMIIAKMQTPPDEASAAAHLKAFEEKGPEVEREAEAARKLINAIIEDPSTPSDDVALTPIDERINTAVNDLRHRLNELLLHSDWCSRCWTSRVPSSNRYTGWRPWIRHQWTSSSSASSPHQPCRRKALPALTIAIGPFSLAAKCAVWQAAANSTTCPSRCRRVRAFYRVPGARSAGCGFRFLRPMLGAL